MAHVLAADEVLAGLVLRLANSAVIGHHGPSHTLVQAVSTLGTQRVRAVILTASAQVLMRRVGRQELPLRVHALLTGLVSRLLARDLWVNPDQAFLAGLFHDLGRTVLHLADPDADLLALDEGPALLAAEREHYGQTHAMVGAALLRQWGVERPIPEAVLLHHDGDRVSATKRLALLVIAAEAVVAALRAGAPTPPALPPGLPLILDRHRWEALVTSAGVALDAERALFG